MSNSKSITKRVRKLSATGTTRRVISATADEHDVNRIIDRAQRTGVMPIGREMQFGNLSAVDDYQTALQRVLDAETSFKRLPSRIRDRFHNNPSELLVFTSDRKNYSEAIRLGIVQPPRRTPKVTATPAVTPSSAGPTAQATK